MYFFLKHKYLRNTFLHTLQVEALTSAGVKVVDSPAKMGVAMLDLMK